MYLNAFILCGLICMLGQLLIELTNLTPAHTNTILVVLGAFLSMIGVYDKLVDFSIAGASVPITNFGHILFKGAYAGFLEDGFTGLLQNIFSLTGGGLTVTILIAFVIGILFKPKH